MKKTGFYLILVTMIASLFSGCSKQELMDSLQGQSQKIIISGTVETKKVSRSAVTDAGEFSWMENDAVMVMGSDNLFHPFILTDGAGKCSGQFSAEVSDDVRFEDGAFAISPAAIKPYTKNGSLRVVLPSSYDCTNGQTNAFMYSELNNGKLSFKNMGGLVKFSVNNIKNDCQIVVTSTYQLSGEMEVIQDNGFSILKSQITDKIYEVALSSNSTQDKQSFYLPLPVSTEPIRLNVKVYEGETCKLEKNTQLTIHRNQLILMPTLILPETDDAVVNDATSTEELNNALANAESNEVVITVNSNSNKGNDETSAIIEITNDITIPSQLTTSENASVNITFDEVPVAVGDNENIVLTDNETSTSGESSSTITVAIPEVTNNVKAPSFEIKLESSTVTLAATQETATFGTVWAATADNTLIVDEGVVVENLVANKGSIEISGTVNGLKRDENHQYGDEKTQVLVKYGATLNGVINVKDFNIIQEKEPSIKVATIAELKSTLSNPKIQEITLVAPITITDELDLMGKTLIIDESIWSEYPNIQAAITIDGTDGQRVSLKGSTSGKIKGYLKEKLGDKFLIRTSSEFELFEVQLEATGTLGGVSVENAEFYLTNSYVGAARPGMVLSMMANTKNAFTHMSGGKIAGNVHIINEYENDENSAPTGMNIMNGSVINGDFVVNGSATGSIYITIYEGVTINANLQYEEDAEGAIKLQGEDTPNGEGWPNSGQGSGNKQEERTVSDFEELMGALELKNVNILIDESFNLTAPITIKQGQKVVLNLQGNTLSVVLPNGYVNPEGLGSGGAFIKNQGNLSIINGTLNGQTVADGNFVRFFLNENADSFFLNGVTINNNAFRWCISLIGTQGGIENYNETSSTINAQDADAALELAGCEMLIERINLIGNVEVRNNVYFKVNSGKIEGQLIKNGEECTINISEHVEIIDDTNSWPSNTEIEQPDYSGKFEGIVTDYNGLAEALRYKTAIITIGKSFDITGPLMINGNAELYMKLNTLTVAESVGENVFTNRGGLFKIVAGCIVNQSSSTLFYNRASTTLELAGVTVESNSAKYDVWNEGTFNIYNNGEKITSSLTINEIFNTGGTIYMKEGSITGNIMNQSNGIITVNAGSITGNLNFPKASLGNQKASITIASGVTLNGTGWDDPRIIWK